MTNRGRRCPSPRLIKFSTGEINGKVFLNYHSFRTTAQAQKYMTQLIMNFFLRAVLVFSKVMLSKSCALKKDSPQNQ